MQLLQDMAGRRSGQRTSTVERNMRPATHMVQRRGGRRIHGVTATLAMWAALAAASPAAMAERPIVDPQVLESIMELDSAPADRQMPSVQRDLNEVAPAARHPQAEIDRVIIGSQLNTAVIPQAPPSRVSARPSPAHALRFVKRLANEALRVLSDQTLSDKQRDIRLRHIMRKGMNLHLIGKFALGPFWDTAEAALVDQYQKLFGDFVIATYSKHFGRRKVDSITFLGTRMAGQKDVVVNTRFDLAIGVGIPANWRVRMVDGRPQIIDVEIAGISMAMTYRNEFITFMKRNGGQLDNLVSRLRESPT